nr:methyl-accepting chemotaxis protein [Candidatus Pantoea persica]
MQHPDTLFFIFMAISNIHFEEYLYVRNKMIIKSKSTKTTTLDSLLSTYLQKKLNASPRISSSLDMHPLTLIQTESNMLEMWMSGHDTIQISDKMQIKAKAVSSHKGNIKRKIKTHNKQVIYHVVRLTGHLWHLCQRAIIASQTNRPREAGFFSPFWRAESHSWP